MRRIFLITAHARAHARHTWEPWDLAGQMSRSGRLETQPKRRRIKHPQSGRVQPTVGRIHPNISDLTRIRPSRWRLCGQSPLGAPVVGRCCVGDRAHSGRHRRLEMQGARNGLGPKPSYSITPRGPALCCAVGGMALNKLRIDAVDVSGKRVFIRVDFNVPQDGRGVAVQIHEIPCT